MLVAEVLHVLRRRADHVVVDTPARFDDQVLAALDLSDRVVLVATLDRPALRKLTFALETLRLLGYPRDRWLVVVNRADSQVGLSPDEAQAMLEVPITALIPSSREVPASVNRGVPLAVADPDHPVSLAIRELAARHLDASWLLGTSPRPIVGESPGDDDAAARGVSRSGWRIGRRR
jgi:pilus assembly protein CpaE